MAFTKPLPEWNKTEIKPAQTILDDGWQAQEKPPASVFNWFQNTTFAALQELQQNAVHIDQIGEDIEKKIVFASTAPTDTTTLWVDTTDTTQYILNAYNGAKWVPIGAKQKVTSVNDKTGDVNLSYGDVGAASANHSHPSATETVAGFMGTADKTKLDGIETGAQKNTVTSVAGKTGAVSVTKTDVGLSNVTNVAQAAQVDFDNHTKDHGAHVSYAAATGSANVYAVTISPAPTAYTDGMAVAVKINVDATGASTINVNGLGATPIKKANGIDVTNLKAGGIYTFRYDGANFILQGEGASGNATASDLLSGKTATTDAGEITGIIPNNGSLGTITPGTSNKNIPAGYTSGGTVAGDPDLIASNILSGKNIFGVNGNVQPKYMATGTTATSGTGELMTADGNNWHGRQFSKVHVTGLGFKPVAVAMSFYAGGNNSVYTTHYIYDTRITVNSNHELVSLSEEYYNSTTNGTAYVGMPDGMSYAYVKDGEFLLPINTTGSINWIALG